MVLILAIFALAQMDNPAKTGLEGRWRNPNSSVIIIIESCNLSVCGRVEWASEKAVDDARKRGAVALIGATLLNDVVAKGDGRWKARLFVPDLGKTSGAELRLVGTDRLKVTGCALGRVLCKSQIWTRIIPE